MANGQQNPFAGLGAVEAQPSPPTDPFEGLLEAPEEPQTAPQEPAGLEPSPTPSPAALDPFKGLSALPELDEDARGLDNTLSEGSDQVESRLLESVKFGLQELNNPLEELRSLSRKVFGEQGDQVLGVVAGAGPLALSRGVSDLPAFQPAQGFEPKTFSEKAAAFVVSDLPVLLSTGGTGGVFGNLASRALGLGTKAIARRATMKVASRVVRGGVEFGVLGAADEAVQQAQRKQFDLGELGSAGLTAGAIGALGLPLFAPLARRARIAFKSRKALKRVRFRKAQEAKVLARAERVDPSDVNSARQLAAKVDPLEKQAFAAMRRASDPALEPLVRQQAQQEAATTAGKLASLEREWAETLQGKAYKNYVDSRRAFGDLKVKVRGKDVLVADQSLNPKGILLKPGEIVQLLDAKDISRLDASALGTKDIIRLTQQSDGELRGFLRQSIVDPIENANRVRLNHEAKFRTALRSKVQELGVSTSARDQQRLFRAAEDPLLLAGLSQPEKEFVNFTKKTYSDLLDAVNRVNALGGLPLVKKRQNYVTHLQQLSFAQRMGLKPGSELVEKGAKRSKTAFAFEKARTGGADVQENLLEALEGYVGPALRRVHMTRAAAEVQARAKFLPPNLRKSVEAWVEGPVLGGLDTKDEFIIRNGAEGALKVAEGLSSALSAGVIGGSLRVLVQQPSQILGTGVLTGVKPMLTGLAKAFRNPPKNIAARSNFLTGRTIRDELIPTNISALNQFNKFANLGLEYADRYVARASWYAGFDKAKSLGMSDTVAIGYADDVGRMLHASYQEILKPAALRGRSGKAGLQFQTFMFNQWNLLKNDPRVLAELNNTTRLRETMKLVGATLATNQIYEGLGLPQPFSLELPAEVSAGAALQTAAGAAQQVPIVGAVLSSALGQSTFRTPSPLVETVGQGVRAFKDAAVMVLSDDEERRERSAQRVNRFWPKLVPAGNQARNFVEGYAAARDGYYQVGDVEVDLDELDRAVARVLGPTAAPSVRKEFRQRQLLRIKGAIGEER